MKNILKTTLFISFLISKLAFSMTSNSVFSKIDDWFDCFFDQLVADDFFSTIRKHPSNIQNILTLEIRASQRQKHFKKSVSYSYKGFKMVITLVIHPSQKSFSSENEYFYSKTQIIVDILPPYLFTYGQLQKPQIEGSAKTTFARNFMFYGNAVFSLIQRDFNDSQVISQELYDLYQSVKNALDE
jgi:hypothetical protein